MDAVSMLGWRSFQPNQLDPGLVMMGKALQHGISSDSQGTGWSMTSYLRVALRSTGKARQLLAAVRKFACLCFCFLVRLWPSCPFRLHRTHVVGLDFCFESRLTIPVGTVHTHSCWLLDSNVLVRQKLQHVVVCSAVSWLACLKQSRSPVNKPQQQTFSQGSIRNEKTYTQRVSVYRTDEPV
jgi:hypothetical protein